MLESNHLWEINTCIKGKNPCINPREVDLNGSIKRDNELFSIQLVETAAKNLANFIQESFSNEVLET